MTGSERRGAPWSAKSSRRELLACLFALPAIAQAQDLVTIPSKRPMLLHNDRPEDLETPANYFDTWLTPNDAFFVRQHLPRPQIEEANFRVSLEGRVSKQLELKVADLRNLP
jgi:DMSO/TMAO reductase YedYZ molybdopterin-dependent catalytic subunit